MANYQIKNPDERGRDRADFQRDRQRREWVDHQEGGGQGLQKVSHFHDIFIISSPLFSLFHFITYVSGTAQWLDWRMLRLGWMLQTKMG